MTKEDYILTQAKELKKMTEKRKKLNAKVHEHASMTQNAFTKLCNEISWISMEIDKTKERIGYVLGHLTLFELRKQYSPSGWQTYEGIEGELRNLKFD